MPKIQNVALSGRSVVTSIGKYKLDNEGVAEINDEKYYNPYWISKGSRR